MGVPRELGIGPDSQPDTFSTDRYVMRDAFYRSIGTQSCPVGRIYHGG